MEQSISQKYVQKVLDMPQLQHGAVRVGLWIAGAAERTGGFPVELYYSYLINGFNRNGVVIPGVAFRPPTVQKSLIALQELGLLTIEEGPMVGGHAIKRCTLNLD